jgi:uncharacterized membrane-anchored protein YjiN (DUF445 family)
VSGLVMSGDEEERTRDLARMKGRATGLLVAAAVVFVVARVLEGDRTWLGFVRATAEAAMVGGLADWFAVTALFRRPLGLPIPHTALIPTRKDQLGRSLGSFVEQNFLAPDAIAERLRAARVAVRVATWAVAPGNAAVVSRHVSAALAGATDVLRDEEIESTIEGAVVDRVRKVHAAPLAGRLLEIATAEGRHRPLIDAGAVGAVRFLDEHQAVLRERFGTESPWWVPDTVDDRIFTKLFVGLRGFLVEVATTPDHELRGYLDDRLAELVVRLRSDPELLARGEAWKEELLDHPAVRAWTGSLWGELKQTVREQSTDPASTLRRRLESAVAHGGQHLLDDPSLQDKIDRWIEGVVRYVISQEGHQVGELIASTVARWDPDEASERIEVQVGRDLQFIRINGTVVGGLAGLVIHTVGHLIG